MNKLAFALMCVLPAVVYANSPAANVGLGIYVSNGTYSKGVDATAPGQLHVLDDNIPRYLEEFDVAEKLPTTAAQGLTPVMTTGAFANLDWKNVVQVPCHVGQLEDWRYEIDNVHWLHTKCYAKANWMENATAIGVTPLDTNGHLSGLPLGGLAGVNAFPLVSDSWWERRFVARVAENNCQARLDCSNPDSFAYAEALIQVRVNQHTEIGVPITNNTANFSLDVLSGLKLVHLATIPVYHDGVNTNAYTYGLKASLAVITPTPASGFFTAGSTIQFQVTYTDNNGHRFFPQGFLPSYGAALFQDPTAAGIQYLTYVDDPFLYIGHKNTQSDMAFTMAGPIDKMNKIGSAWLTINEAFLPQIPEATVVPDGYNADVQIFPPTFLVFPCLFSLAPGSPGLAPQCFVTVTDIFTMTIPSEGQAGTWTAQIKARRLWEGEPLQAASSVRFQVGQKKVTQFTPHMTGCQNCHMGTTSITRTSHGFQNTNGDQPECLSCHTTGYGDMFGTNGWFEDDAGFDVRILNIHKPSQRFKAMGGTTADVTFHPAP